MNEENLKAIEEIAVKCNWRLIHTGWYASEMIFSSKMAFCELFAFVIKTGEGPVVKFITTDGRGYAVTGDDLYYFGKILQIAGECWGLNEKTELLEVEDDKD